jgi:acetolactate synthase-1/3 small subunit
MLKTIADQNIFHSVSFNNCTIKLRVNNHPGVMSHICGLFARRAFNVEKILCLPIKSQKESMIFITVDTNQSLNQITKQLIKLEDVTDVSWINYQDDVFMRIEGMLDEDLKCSGQII